MLNNINDSKVQEHYDKKVGRQLYLHPLCLSHEVVDFVAPRAARSTGKAINGRFHRCFVVLLPDVEPFPSICSWENPNVTVDVNELSTNLCLYNTDPPRTYLPLFSVAGPWDLSHLRAASSDSVRGIIESSLSVPEGVGVGFPMPIVSPDAGLRRQHPLEGQSDRWLSDFPRKEATA